MTRRDGRTQLEHHRRLSIPRQRIHKSPLSSALPSQLRSINTKTFSTYDRSAANNSSTRKKRMSQYQEPVEGASSPALSGTTADLQRRDPVSPRGTEHLQGAGGREEEHSERDTNALDIFQALGEIQQTLRQLHSTLRSDHSETVTPYQQASFGVLTNIADDIAECLHWLRRMSSNNEATARPEQPSLGSDVPENIAPVLQREGANTDEHQTAYPVSGVLPADGSRGVAPTLPPPVFQATGLYEVPAEAGQLLQGARGGYAYHPHQDINAQAFPYVQSHVPFPPSPGLYQSQWVQSPPVSPLVSTPFCYHHNHCRPFVSPATIPDPAVVPPPPPPPPNTTPNHIHQETCLRGAQGQQRQQQGQPRTPPPGAGVTMSFPLHYDTPAGPRMTLYHSHLPGHHHPLYLSPQPVLRGSGARQAPAGPDGHRPSARPSERFARVDSDSGSDSEDGLDSPGPELRWSGVFEGGFSP